MGPKELLKQYVNTGARLQEYQVNKLSSNLLKSYLRTRLIASIEGGHDVSLKYYEFELFPDDMKEKYVNDNEKYFPIEFYTALSPKLRLLYIEKEVSKGPNAWLTYGQYKTAPDNLKWVFIKNTKSLSTDQWEVTPDKMKVKYIKIGSSVDDQLYLLLSDNLKQLYLTLRLESGGYLTRTQYKGLPDNLKSEYLTFPNRKDITRDEVMGMITTHKEKFINRINSLTLRDSDNDADALYGLINDITSPHYITQQNKRGSWYDKLSSNEKLQFSNFILTETKYSDPINNGIPKLPYIDFFTSIDQPYKLHKSLPKNWLYKCLEEADYWAYMCDLKRGGQIEEYYQIFRELDVSEERINTIKKERC